MGGYRMVSSIVSRSPAPWPCPTTFVPFDRSSIVTSNRYGSESRVCAAAVGSEWMARASSPLPPQPQQERMTETETRIAARITSETRAGPRPLLRLPTERRGDLGLVRRIPAVLLLL